MSRALAITAAVFITPGLLYAQRTSLGFSGGVNLTRDFPTYRQSYVDSLHLGGLTHFDLFSDTHSFIAGLSVEVELGKNLSLSANALHRDLKLRSRHIFPAGSAQDAGRSVVSTWQWPVLVKYRLPSRGTIRPFVEAGPSFRTRHDPAPTEPSQFGATVGIGGEFRRGPFRVFPALRYTRWRYDGDFPRFATRRDQIELVTGISYATSVPSWEIRGKKLWFGLAGGIPFTNGLEHLPGGSGEKKGYIAGLAAELELNRHASIELNGLYKPFRGNLAEFTVLTWQFPLLAKIRFRPQSGVQSFIEAGPSFRLAGNLNAYNPSRYGFTVGGGIQTYYRALKTGPVLRYTHWARDPKGGGFFPGPRTASNQLELLFSFTF